MKSYTSRTKDLPGYVARVVSLGLLLSCALIGVGLQNRNPTIMNAACARECTQWHYHSRSEHVARHTVAR